MANPVPFLLDNLLLIAATLVIGGLLAWPLVRERLGGPSVSTLLATQMINSRSAQVIDVREAAEFAEGSLPGARNLPLTQLKERAAELKKDRPVIVVCAHGRTASIGAARLRTAGFAEVFILAGGLAAWREAGLPLRR